MTIGRYSEVDLVLKLLGRDLEWSLLTGGRYSEVVISSGLTVAKFCEIDTWCESNDLRYSSGLLPYNFILKEADHRVVVTKKC